MTRKNTNIVVERRAGEDLLADGADSAVAAR
jgi:hypothetical protein